MNNPKIQARHARRNLRAFAELLDHVGDGAGAREARRQARAAQLVAVQWDKPAKYRPGARAAA